MRIMKEDEVPEIKPLTRRYRWKHLADAIINANGQWVLVGMETMRPRPGRWRKPNNTLSKDTEISSFPLYLGIRL